MKKIKLTISLLIAINFLCQAQEHNIIGCYYDDKLFTPGAVLDMASEGIVIKCNEYPSTSSLEDDSYKWDIITIKLEQ